MNEETESFFQRLNYILFERGYKDHKMPTIPVLTGLAAAITGIGTVGYYLNEFTSSGKDELFLVALAGGTVISAVGFIVSYVATDNALHKNYENYCTTNKELSKLG